MSGHSTRRELLGALTVAAPAAAIGTAMALRPETLKGWLFDSEESLSRRAQRLLVGDRLAPEFSRADISPVFPTNGSTAPKDPGYLQHADDGFRDWRLTIRGLVEKPMEISLAMMHEMPRRTQITRHDCVEGWSAIAEWTGVPLGHLLGLAGPKPGARFVIFRCADEPLRDSPYYESIDLEEAFHPQTILAYRMNGETLPVPYGAPLRLRVERQLGYKHAKFVKDIEVVDTLKTLMLGNGGFWEDLGGYHWYAGI